MEEEWRLKTYLALPIPAPAQGAGSSVSSGKRKAGWGAAAAFSPEIASENDQTLHWESDDNLGPGSRSRGGERGRSGVGHHPLPARQDLLILRSQGWRCHLGSGRLDRQSLSYPSSNPAPQDRLWPPSCCPEPFAAQSRICQSSGLGSGMERLICRPEGSLIRSPRQQDYLGP